MLSPARNIQFNAIPLFLRQWGKWPDFPRPPREAAVDQLINVVVCLVLAAVDQLINVVVCLVLAVV